MTLTSNEIAHIESFRQISESEDFDIDYEDQGTWHAGESSLPPGLPKGVHLGPAIECCRLRVDELACYWSAEEDDRDFGGEFCLSDIHNCLQTDPPNLAWDGSSADDIELFSQLRIIDSTPRSGLGFFAAIRLQPQKDPLEIWFHDVELREPESPVPYLKMDLTYCEYLDALLLTKGTFYWQYLFTDIPMRGRWFERRVPELKAMLEAFPALFPEHDYSSLAERLKERL